MKKIALFAVTAMFAGGVVHAAPYEKPFKKMDTDGDGAVTQAEWDADKRNPKNFKQGDTDGDGKMTLAEFAALNEKWKAANAAKAQ